MIQSVSIPISTAERRLRAGFLDHCLASLFRHSSRDHEVLLVTETPLPVREFVQARGWPQRRVRVIEADPHGEAVPVYRFLNVGVRAASEPWVMIPAGDDSYFPPGWEWVLNAVDPARAGKAVWVPRYMSVVPRPSGNVPRFGQQSPNERSVFPAEGDSTIEEPALLEAVREWTTGEMVEEVCGKRDKVSWPHSIVSRELFERVGGYAEAPPYPSSNDLHFCDALRDRFGVTAVGVHSSCIVNARVRVKIDY